MKPVLWRLSIITIATLLVGLAAFGCGNAPATSSTATKTATATSTSTTKTAASSTVSSTTKTTTTAKGTTATSTTTQTTTVVTTTAVATKTPTKTVSNDPFTRLDDTLDEMNVYFQKTWMAAEAIGAKEGYKYATRSGTFELYLYDKESEAYRLAVTNNAIALNDTLFPAIIKDGFALYFYGNAKEELKTQIQGILFP